MDKNAYATGWWDAMRACQEYYGIPTKPSKCQHVNLTLKLGGYVCTNDECRKVMTEVYALVNGREE